MGLPSLMMNNLLLPRCRRTSRSAREELKKWRRNWKLRDRLVPRLRGRDLTLPEKLSSWENVSWRPEEQPMLKLNLTRREKHSAGVHPQQSEKKAPGCHSRDD